jgi:hypothetical protein
VSLREPADFGGLPIVDPDGGPSSGACLVPRITFAPPRFAVEAAADGGVIFLDELTTAPPAVQAALLRAVVDRAFSDLELDPSRVAIVAAANPSSDAAGAGTWCRRSPSASPTSASICRRTTGPRRSPATGAARIDVRWPGRRPAALAPCTLAGGRVPPRTAVAAAAAPGRRQPARRGLAVPRIWDYATRLIAAAE